MELSTTLQSKIIDFLKSLPNLDDARSRRAFIYSAGIGKQLEDQIRFDEPLAQFVPLFVETLLDYGTLDNGKYAIAVVLEATKDYIGQDKKEYCNALIQEFHDSKQEQFQRFPKTIKKRYKTFTFAVGIIVGLVCLYFLYVAFIYNGEPKSASSQELVYRIQGIVQLLSDHNESMNNDVAVTLEHWLSGWHIGGAKEFEGLSTIALLMQELPSQGLYYEQINKDLTDLKRILKNRTGERVVGHPQYMDYEALARINKSLDKALKNLVGK